MKRFKPTTPGRRGMTVINYRELLTTDRPFKKLVRGRKQQAGRNSHGRITQPHKGGGHKRNYRMVDFRFIDKMNIPARVETIEYDPYRSAFIALVCYADGERRYILVPQKVTVGTKVMTSSDAPLEPGNRLPLTKIPVGTFVYNIETQPEGGAKLVRSAGVFAQVSAQTDTETTLEMPSGEVRKVSNKCFASIGEVSNPEHKLVNLGKAGRSRWKGIRPTVRGSAMNPVDHPHGGGEGRQGISLRRGPKTRHGKQAYGVRTRTPKKYSNRSIVSRRKTKRFQ
jgi:large subunit ribosomal protein L2